jgi:uncharacterized protein YqgV (UPF0045/DUF77 family)
MGVVRRCLEDLEKDCERISITMKLDHRKGKRDALAAKVEGVERALGRKLRT